MFLIAEENIVCAKCDIPIKRGNPVCIGSFYSDKKKTVLTGQNICLSCLLKEVLELLGRTSTTEGLCVKAALIGALDFAEHWATLANSEADIPATELQCIVRFRQRINHYTEELAFIMKRLM